MKTLGKVGIAVLSLGGGSSLVATAVATDVFEPSGTYFSLALKDSGEHKLFCVDKGSDSFAYLEMTLGRENEVVIKCDYGSLKTKNKQEILTKGLRVASYNSLACNYYQGEEGVIRYECSDFDTSHKKLSFRDPEKSSVRLKWSR
ncbi:hypothetical protein MHLP_02955 [Candidatus Mycoplasma haematolamae str. Purdue]|uniref:Lipoprotein n=1 Tax=Mycoplasma haematolamae (strain Purdue) TaxID=1212765 RepID=I7CG14_MYCHA|nr:hypothetical protein [Candidatus Mycoplasma haematolamae]AFO52171.1 hypothetical protein MHLP_02955 [Candidatus Mycoplasma haematolamae str. Purdue]